MQAEFFAIFPRLRLEAVAAASRRRAEQGKALRGPSATPFLWSCPKKREWRPKEKRSGANQSVFCVFLQVFVSQKWSSRCRMALPNDDRGWLRFARAADGTKYAAFRRLPVSAATAGSNARFWRLTPFTLRDDHLTTPSSLVISEVGYDSHQSGFLFGV